MGVKRTGRTGAVIAGSLAGLAWLRSRVKKRRTGDGALLLDDSATPAPYPLSQLHESPGFEVDESGRPFATVEDLDAPGRGVSAPSRPSTIDESIAD